MSTRSANGPTGQQFAAGEIPEVVLPVIPGSITLTNELQAADFIGANNAYIFKMDCAGYRQVRLTGRVTTVSASVNTPIIYIRYATSFTTTVGSYVQMGQSAACSFSMFTGATLGDSGWIDLAELAKINDCFIGVFTSGGDGAADPVLANVLMHFR